VKKERSEIKERESFDMTNACVGKRVDQRKKKKGGGEGETNVVKNIEAAFCHLDKRKTGG